MNKKPSLYAILLIAHCLEPILKWLLWYLITQDAPALGQSLVEFILIWLLVPICASMLIIKKDWSLNFFGFLHFLNLIVNIIAIITSYRLTPWILLLPHLATIALSASSLFAILGFGPYQLLTANGAKEFSSLTRTPCFIPCILMSIDNSERYSSRILNISQGGIFLEEFTDIQQESEYILIFDWQNNTIQTRILLVNKQSFNNINGYGCKFLMSSLADNILLKKMVSKIIAHHRG